jgi:hypothetical protein
VLCRADDLANFIAGVNQVLDTRFEMTLGLDQHILCPGEIIEGSARPVTFSVFTEGTKQ